MNQILIIWGKIVRAFLRMPVVLKSISLAMFLLFFCIPVALLPTKMLFLFVKGNIEAFNQFRMNGGSVLLFSVGCAAIVVIYGLMAPRKWVKHVVLVLGIILFLTPLKYSDWNSGEIILSLIIFVFVPYWVFYVNPSVKRYLKGSAP